MAIERRRSRVFPGASSLAAIIGHVQSCFRRHDQRCRSRVFICASSLAIIRHVRSCDSRHESHDPAALILLDQLAL